MAGDEGGNNNMNEALREGPALNWHISHSALKYDRPPASTGGGESQDHKDQDMLTAINVVTGGDSPDMTRD